MNLKLLFLLVIFIIITYLAYILYSKNDKKNVVKKVRFFGLPTEIDDIKPTFTNEPITNKNIYTEVNPLNNLEDLSEYSVNF
jgi:hypothetical protein